MAKRLLRRALSAPGLLRVVRACFDEVNDPVSGRRFSLSDCLMSGLAVFGLKYPSLLQFDRDARTDEVVRANLRALYAIERAPCDTALRERLDEVDPRALRGVFKRVFAQLQRGKGLEGFTCLDGHYLLSVDGTGYFSSSSVHCNHCCEKHHKDGRVTYYHQMLGAVVVHPEQREVFPLAPEPIVKGDGATKNDCERNAAKRLLGDVRREHPHLKLIVVEELAQDVRRRVVADRGPAACRAVPGARVPGPVRPLDIPAVLRAARLEVRHRRRLSGGMPAEGGILPSFGTLGADAQSAAPRRDPGASTPAARRNVVESSACAVRLSCAAPARWTPAALPPPRPATERRPT